MFPGSVGTPSLADGIARFAVSGGQLALLLIGLQANNPSVRAAIAAGIAALSFIGWLAAVNRSRAIGDTPTSQIATAAQGYVELVGTGKALEGLPLKSPITGAPCLWYHFKVETRGDKGGWEVSREETSDASFLIRDATGECLVDPDGAEVLSSRKQSWKEDESRYTQWLLMEEKICVLGQFTTYSGLDLQLDRSSDIGDLLAEWKQDRAGLLKRFDLDGDGEISLQEWELVRDAATREVEGRHREARANADLHMMRHPETGQLFLISNLSLDKLAQRYQWWAWGHLMMFFLGLAGIAIFLALR